MKADSRFDEVESYAAAEAIPFGAGVAAEAGNVDLVRVPNKDVATLVFDADFVTSNTIDLDVNGVSIAQVTFATDHDTTAGLVRAAIAALPNVSCILDPSDANKRTFIIEEENTTIVVDNVVVAGGASQAGSSVTYAADDVFRGIALSTQKEQAADGTTQYNQYEAVSVLRKGVAWVNASKAVTADATAYLIPDGTGKFTDASSGNIEAGTFRSTVAAAGLVKVQVNL
jgi:hypothetical protein